MSSTDSTGKTTFFQDWQHTWNLSGYDSNQPKSDQIGKIATNCFVGFVRVVTGFVIWGDLLFVAPSILWRRRNSSQLEEGSEDHKTNIIAQDTLYSEKNPRPLYPEKDSKIIGKLTEAANDKNRAAVKVVTIENEIYKLVTDPEKDPYDYFVFNSKGQPYYFKKVEKLGLDEYLIDRAKKGQLIEGQLVPINDELYRVTVDNSGSIKSVGGTVYKNKNGLNVAYEETTYNLVPIADFMNASDEPYKTGDSILVDNDKYVLDEIKAREGSRQFGFVLDKQYLMIRKGENVYIFKRQT